MPLLYAALGLALLYAAWYAYANLRFPGEPPVVSGWIPFLGAAVDFGRDSVGFLKACQRKHGDIFTLILVGKRMTFVMAPEDIPIIFKERKALNFVQAIEQVEVNTFGLNIKVQRTIDKWVHQWWQIGLQQSGSIAELSSQVMKHLKAELDKKVQLGKGEEGQKTDLWDLLFPVIFNSATKTFFGHTGFDYEALQRDFKTFDASFPLLASGVPAWLAGSKAIEARERLAMQMKEQGRRNAEANKLVRNRDEKFTETFDNDMDRCRSHTAFFWGMQANTLPAAFWTAAFVHQDENAVKALREEVASIVRAKEGFRSWKLGEDLPEFTHGDLKSMVRLEGVVMESLRMASDSLSPRKVLFSKTLQLNSGKYTFRAGDNVVISTRTLHQDSDIFESPERFVWNRFTEENGDSKGPSLRKYFTKAGRKINRSIAFMPFGGGVSHCPGRFMAVNEIKLLQILLLCNYDITVGPVPKFDKSRAGFGVLSPAGKCEVVLKRL